MQLEEETDSQNPIRFFFSIWEKDGTAMWMSMTNVVLVYEILVKYNLKSTAAYNSAVKGFW